MLFRVLVLFLLTTILFSPPNLIKADESSLSLSPAIHESVIKPGESLQQVELLLTNLTNFPLPIKGWPAPFLANEQTPSQINYDASSWFSLEPSDFILQPSERKKVILTITAPRDAEPGGHYATVFFQPLIPEGLSGNPQALARVGVLVLLIVPGNIKEAVSASAPTLPSWQAFGPVNFTLEFTNNGNVHSVVNGELKISNLFYQNLGTIPLPSTTILPGTKKGLQLNWDKRLGFGKYIFTPSLYYGANHQQVTLPPFTFWLIPWPAILFLISLLTFILKFFIFNGARIKKAWIVLTNKELHHKEQ